MRQQIRLILGVCLGAVLLGASMVLAGPASAQTTFGTDAAHTDSPTVSMAAGTTVKVLSDRSSSNIEMLAKSASAPTSAKSGTALSARAAAADNPSDSDIATAGLIIASVALVIAIIALAAALPALIIVLRQRKAS